MVCESVESVRQAADVQLRSGDNPHQNQQNVQLARDYEALPGNSASMITIAMIDNLARRLTDETTPTWRDPQTT